MKILSFIFFHFLVSFLKFCFAVDTISTAESIIDGNTLISSSETFELGFFSPGDPKDKYLGIWYKNMPQVVVWVANREKPVTVSNGTLVITNTANLVILDGKNTTVWSSNSSRVAENPVAQLLDSGNFVVREKGNTDSTSYIWQSFDLLSDTQVSGMELGWNFSSGLNQFLTSWKTATDPSPGNYTYGIENRGLPQLVLAEKSKKKYRSGVWNGDRFSGLIVKINPIFYAAIYHNTGEFYYKFEVNETLADSWIQLTPSGIIERCVSYKNSNQWSVLYMLPGDLCDNYGQCGANAVCNINRRPTCDCLPGFIPKFQREWDGIDWSGGCVRRTPLDCQKGEGFLPLKGLKLPDLVEFSLNNNISLEDCKAECLEDCSCKAYASSNISNGGIGCLTWYGDLIDIREFIVDGSDQYIYIRMPASELKLNEGSNGNKRKLAIRVVGSTISVLLILGLACWCIIWKKRRQNRGSSSKGGDLDLPLFDLVTIANATENFCWRNKIGEGGFGPVYKGELPVGQYIAVKRLSQVSGQGFEEFKNEVKMISKLQHRNLVRLLGFCVDGEECMLVYEYMPNKSLDCFIFDQGKKALLNWQKRFDIIMGIARGLLYLHHDSRLRIIHRDLKTSNILLDSELNPKISDFGIAKVFGGDQVEGKTKRVVGTYGYMSPEYAIDGKFSEKSDVFSFGVLLLEIVSGRRNRGFSHQEHHHNLLGHAWLLWDKQQAFDLIDQCLKDSCIESQVLRCIQVGLLCVQKLPRDRPPMTSVVFMLGNEGATLPQPKHPGFFIERISSDTDITDWEETHLTQNAVTITVMEAR